MHPELDAALEPGFKVRCGVWGVVRVRCAVGGLCPLHSRGHAIIPSWMMR